MIILDLVTILVILSGHVFVGVSVLRSLVMVTWCTHGCLTSKVTQREKQRKRQRPPHAERSTFHVDATKDQAPQLELPEFDHPLACVHRLQILYQV